MHLLKLFCKNSQFRSIIHPEFINHRQIEVHIKFYTVPLHRKKKQLTMLLPIVGYGLPILRERAKEIDKDYEGLSTLLANMWETMYHSNGVGLAAPQIDKGIRLFVMDSAQIFANVTKEDEEFTYPDKPGLKSVVINPIIIRKFNDIVPYEEGCLSIPGLREDIMREASIEVEYLDENFEKHTATLHGLTARVFQHEFDHLEGKLYIDYLKPLKRKMLGRKLDNIVKGKVAVEYRMKFAKK